MTEERIKDRIDWVHVGLFWWLRTLYGTALQPTRNAAPAAQQVNRLEHSWVDLGTQPWEKAELSLYQQPPHLTNWTTVREFQRDIMTWVKVWHDCIYAVPGCRHPVRMSALLNQLIERLHTFTGNVEVAVVDPSDELIHIWVRLKNYPDAFACLVSLPKLSDHPVY